MIERPILFSGEMVRAILEGRKTMTRRVIKPQPPNWVTKFGYTCFTPKGAISGRGEYWDNVGEKFFRSPYGQPGDGLWVRETWRAVEQFPPPGNFAEKIRIEYRACGEQWFNKGKWKSPCRLDYQDIWRPSIFMPRWASRITLEITNIKVERVQEISEEDAIKEGIEKQSVCNNPMFAIPGDGKARYSNPVSAFEDLWNYINGKKHPWESNPWAWVIKFKVVTPAKAVESQTITPDSTESVMGISPARERLR